MEKGNGGGSWQMEDGGNGRMKMKKRSFVSVFLVSLVILTAGCGKTLDTKGGVSNNDISIPVKVDNASVKELDSKLGAINDEQSASAAVTYFMDYVDSRLDRSASGMSTSSVKDLMSPERIKYMADAEMAARGGQTIMTVGGGTIDPSVDIGNITDTINRLGKDQHIRVTDELIKTAKVAAESSLPNMNPKSRSAMTPLEAMVISYSLMSGDDGTASPESVKLPIEKVQQFVDVVTQQ
jgi:hypothetical protein